MKSACTALLRLGLIGLALGVPATALAQTSTTGALSGEVVDESGGLLPGASVGARHEPTGTEYAATTGSEGRFHILNVRVGGPYTVTVSLSGFKEQQQTGISVNLGEERHLTFRLPLETVQETVIVVAEAGSIINPSHTGPASNVDQAVIETLPTVSRSLEDMARTNPYFAPTATNADPSAISVAGRSNRYNNVQIDGAVNNDLFGLAATGTPGGQTEAQPISLDAIQEIQLLVAPYDVRQGGFSGGGLNAITRSGSNEFRGTAYYYTRNEGMVGSLDGREVGTFDDTQGGLSIGGPLLRDKAFFFINGEITRKDLPSGVSADGSSGTTFARPEDAARFRQILTDVYGFDPGSLGEFTRGVNSNKLFGRLDFNLSPRHQLTLRHNFVKADNDIGRPGSTFFIFPTFFYEIRDTTNSTVAQLNSNFGRFVNELRVTYQTVRDRRTGQPGDRAFPRVTVNLPGGPDVVAGTENFSTANELDQDIIEITNDLTWSKGNHLVTFGTHNEFFEFRNLFIRDNFGNYEFDSLDLLEQGIAQAYDHSFSTTLDPRQPARFKVNQFGFYVGDLWRASPRLTLNGGVRVDLPSFPDTPTRNPAAETGFGFRTDVVPSPAMWSPRLGFNWDVTGDAKNQVRGGAGIFAGRTPYVWLSNQYGNTGIEFRRLSVRFNRNNRIPFIADPGGQYTDPSQIAGASVATNEIDMVDPGYDFPKVFRGNVAYDRDLGFLGLIGTAELLFSETLKDIKYENLNIVPTGQTLGDGRPVFTRRDRTFSDVLLLTNTDEGRQWTVSFKLERPFRNGLYASASYLFNRSRSINDGTSSQAISQWRFVHVPGDPNNPALGISNYDAGHRLNAALSYDFAVAGGVRATVSFFYNGQSGRPYSTIFDGDANGDGQFSNDLIYVPLASDPRVVVVNGTTDLLNAYIEGDPGLRDFRGRIVERNTSRSPWTDLLDVKLAVGLPFGNGRKVEITADVLNFLNLLNEDWGRIEFASFNDVQPIEFGGVTDAGQLIYDLSPLTTGGGFRKFDRDDLRSRWQAQLGVRVRF